MILTRIRAAVTISCVLAALLRPAPATAATPASDSPTTSPWTVQRANAWYGNLAWLVGANFNPSTSINQLEMWQADTFDPDTIDRELGWAQELGFNSMRVYLHHLPYQQDPEGFLKRIEQYLRIADRRGMGTMFVLLDSVWDPHPEPGPQRAPKPGVHNSGWVQSPGAEILKDLARHDEMKPYIQGVMNRFRDDKRVQVWDIFNEPDGLNKGAYDHLEPENKEELALELLKKSYVWARETSPSQPITSGIWMGDWSSPEKLTAMQQFQLEESDVVSFHNYGKPEDIEARIGHLRRYNRPILCTEYMARPRGSTFDPVLALLKKEKVAAYHWGLVAGKTQTIYPWDSWKKPYTEEPELWFHDIFRGDGTPYKDEEVKYIKSVTGRAE